MTGFLALLSRDLRLVWRRPGDITVVLAFFVVATVLFPLGICPQANILARIAAGVLWCTALFASMLSLDRLFAADHEDGSLDLLLLAPWPLELAALAKCAAHWIVTGLPLAALAPLLGVTFGLPADALAALAVTLLVGTPTLSLIGGLAAALTLGARRGGALLALLRRRRHRNPDDGRGSFGPYRHSRSPRAGGAGYDPVGHGRRLAAGWRIDKNEPGTDTGQKWPTCISSPTRRASAASASACCRA